MDKALTKSLHRATSSIHGQSSLLSGLDDGLLIEILSRIPSTRSVFQCKSVCKRWYSLLSTRYFVGRFRSRVDQRLLECDDDHINSTDQPLGIIVTSFYESGLDLEVTMAPPQNPNHGKSNNRAIVVLASCNDFILCHSMPDRVKDWSSGYYYLCNPFTNQWLALSKFPGDHTIVHGVTRFGLVCEFAADNCSIYRYRVVRFRRMPHAIKVKTYHSETCEWVDSNDLVGNIYNMVAYNGKLHWLNGHGSRLNTYDPFTTVEQERFSTVDGPRRLGEGEMVDFFNLGECGGVLRVLATQLCIEGFEDLYSQNLKVWDSSEADGNGRRSWSLKHNVPLKTIFPELGLKTTSLVRGVGFGLKKDVVLLQSCDLLVSYNLQNREIKVEGVGKCGRKLTWLDSFFLLQLP